MELLWVVVTVELVSAMVSDIIQLMVDRIHMILEKQDQEQHHDRGDNDDEPKRLVQDCRSICHAEVLHKILFDANVALWTYNFQI